MLRPDLRHWLAFLLLLFAACWSRAASAQAADGCDLSPVSPTSQSGAPGSTLDYQFDLNELGSCEGTGTTGRILIVSDETGGATLSRTTYSSHGNNRFDVSLTLGPNPGNVGFEIVCDTGCGPTTVLFYSATAAGGACDLRPVAPTSQTGPAGSNLAYNFDVIDVDVCDASGVSGAITITSDTTGGATVSPGGFSGIEGRYGFTVTLGPNPGTVGIGIHCDVGCATTLAYTATATAVASACDLQAAPPSEQSAEPGSTLTYHYNVIDNGGCVTTLAPNAVRARSGLTPQLAVQGTIVVTSDGTGGATVSPPTFDKDPGNYSFTVTLGPNPGNVGVRVACSSGCSTTLNYAATATGGAPAMTVSKALTNSSDPDSSDTVTQGDVLTYTVTATNTGNVPLTNVQVNDPLTSPSTTTCASVAIGASCVLVGTHTVTAGDATAGSIVNTGNATSTEVPGPVNSAPVTVIVVGGGPATLAIVSGDGQSVAVGVASAPLVVVLHDGAGNPVADATIAWASDNGTLAHASSVTDSAGQATNTATPAHAGAVAITASSASPAAGPVTFHLSAATQGIAHIAGLSPAQHAVALSLDNACAALGDFDGMTPAQDDLLARCSELQQAAASHPSDVAPALDELVSGAAYLQSTAALQISAAQFDNIKVRIAALRSGTGGQHFGGLAFNGPHGALPVGKTLDALLGATDAKQPEVGADFERWGFFAAGSFGRGSADRTTVLPGFDFDTSGITAGIDYRYNSSVIVGATVGFAHFNSDLDANHGHMDTRGWSVSAYSTMFRPDDWYVDGVVTFGHNDYDIDRRIVYSVTTPSGTTTIDTRARANSSGGNLAGSLTVGRDFQRGGWSIGPYLRGNLARLSFDDYSETLPAGAPGSGLGLAVRSRDVQSASSVLGAKFTFASSQSWGVLMPHAQVEWEHEFKDDPYRMEARFLADPTMTPFVVQGDRLDSDFFRIGLGLSFVAKGGKSGFVYYEKTLGRSGITQDNIALGIRIEF